MRVLAVEGWNVEAVTEAALLDALRSALEGDGPSDAMTTTEMVDRLMPVFGWTRPYTERKVRAAIGEMRRAGKLALVEVRRESPVDGRLCRLRAFRFV